MGMSITVPPVAPGRHLPDTCSANSGSPSAAPSTSDDSSCDKPACCLDCFCCGPGTSWSSTHGQCVSDLASSTGDDDGSCGRVGAKVVTTGTATTATATTITTVSSITVEDPACEGVVCCG